MMIRNSLPPVAFIALTLVCSPGAAQVSAPAPAPAPAPVTLNQGYVLGPGDVIEVALVGRPEFASRQPVQADGTVTLPYLNAVRAGNLSVLQFRDLVARLLREGGFYTDPVVTVGVVTYASRYVTVLGEFGTPGILPVDRPYRVSEILARAGGVRPTAADHIVLRRVDGREMILPIASVASGGPEQDPFVDPSDKLYIPPAPNYYIYGQVGAPGAYTVERGMTLRMALARGGGLTDRGSASRISVYREGMRIKVDLDAPLMPEDTIYVGERFF